MRGWFPALLVLALLLAGCASKSDTSSTTTSTTSTAPNTTSATTTHGTTTTGPSGTTTATTMGTSTGPVANATANSPPTASLVASNATGSVPFNVTFTASGSDPDHDSLNYTLTFGDGTAAKNGTQLPVTVRHQYTLVGNFTARLTVSDGMHSVNVTLLVKSLNVRTLGPQSFSASTTASSAGCPQVVGDIASKPPFNPYPSGNPAEGVEWAKFNLAAGSIGLPIKGIEAYTNPQAGGGALDLYDASSKEIASNLSDTSGHYAASVPAGAVFMVWYPCGPGPANVSLTVG